MTILFPRNLIVVVSSSQSTRYDDAWKRMTDMLHPAFGNAAAH
jgi:hypothetical protein